MTTTEIRRFADKPCAKCERPFTPTGANSKHCNRDDCEPIAAGLAPASNGNGTHAEASRETRSRPRRMATAPTPRPRVKRVVKRAAKVKRRRAVVAPNGKAPDPPALDVFGVIAHFKLDYLLGNVVRFVLEHEDGDELENLDVARTYLEKAIAQREQAEA